MPFRWPWAKPEKRSISFQDVWGSGADLDAVLAGQVGSMAQSSVPVFAATRLISDSASALPIEAFRKAGDRKEKIPTPALFTQPSIFSYGTFSWLQRALVSLTRRGNSFGLITSFTRDGYPLTIEWLHPDDVDLADDRAVARPQWYYVGRPVQPWTGRDSTGELIHIPWYAVPGRVLGLSPIRAFRVEIEAGIAAQRFGRDFFRDNAIPSGVLESEATVDETEAAIVKARFKAAAKGRDVAVLGAGTKWRAVTVPPEDSQFLETIRANATQIAAIYGVPPEMIGGEAGGSLTYNTVEQNALSFATLTLAPYLSRLEEAFSTLLPRPQFVKFNLDGLLRGSALTRARIYSQALDTDKGWMRREEVREIEDLPPERPEQAPELDDGAQVFRLPPPRAAGGEE